MFLKSKDVILSSCLLQALAGGEILSHDFLLISHVNEVDVLWFNAGFTRHGVGGALVKQIPYRYCMNMRFRFIRRQLIQIRINVWAKICN